MRVKLGLDPTAPAVTLGWAVVLRKLRQFQDLMIIILLIAAVVSLVVSREWETPIAIAVVVLLIVIALVAAALGVADAKVTVELRRLGGGFDFGGFDFSEFSKGAGAGTREAPGGGFGVIT